MREPTDDERRELKASNRIREMVATEGWKIYRSILETHLKDKQRAAEAPVSGIDQAIAQNADKGAIYALRLALEIPAGILRVTEDLRAQLGGEVEED